MPEKFNNKEKPKKVKLKIIEPCGDKNFKIEFNCRTKKECEAYNTAIRRVLEKEGLIVYHQVGGKSDDPNAPGYHAWEIWKREITKEYLEGLLLEIEKRSTRIVIILSIFIFLNSIYPKALIPG
jgi:hypothetical protein